MAISRNHCRWMVQQIANYEPQNFNQLPIEPVLNENGQHMLLEVPYPGAVIYAKIWKVNVGRMNLYLLDTDVDLNLNLTVR